MKNLKFGIILATILIVYFLLNYYLIFSFKQYFKLSSSAVNCVGLAILLLILSYFFGRMLEKKLTNNFSAALILFSSIWMGASVYLAILFAIVDLIKFFTSSIFVNPQLTASLSVPSTAIVVLILTAIILIVGYLNVNHPKVRKIKLRINKNGGKLKKLNIVAASDLHIGLTMNKRLLRKIVKIINQLNPDIVLFPGDVVDEDLPRIIKYDLGKPLEQIKSKYGLFAVTGNHEYIGGVEQAKKYLIDKGINLLDDTLFFIDDSFFLIGREDISISFFKGEERMPLKELLNFTEANFPLILLDHQPFRLEEANNNGIDLQLSGHTHNGQLWPFNFITKFVYEKSYGYLLKGNTHYYISSGVGVWGPPVKTAGRAEILQINLEFAGV